MPRNRFSHRFLIRSVAGAALFFGCILSAHPAEVVILKDGFVIQGTVRKEVESFRDPIGPSVTILKAGGFDFIDDGPRMTVFSTHSKQLGEISKDVKIRPAASASSASFIESMGPIARATSA